MTVSRTKPLPRGSLDRERIVEACLTLLERDGAKGFSMPALGRELGADPSGVYRYFRNKDELVVAVTDEFIARLEVENTVGSCWVETLAAMARKLWRVGTEHPGVMALTGSRTAAMPGTFGAANYIIGVYREAGFDPDEAARLYRAMTDAVLAIVQQDALLLDMGAGEQSIEAQQAFRGVDPKRYPHIAAAADTVATVSAEETFELAIAMLLHGVIAAAPNPCVGHEHSLATPAVALPAD